MFIKLNAFQYQIQDNSKLFLNPYKTDDKFTEYLTKINNTVIIQQYKNKNNIFKQGFKFKKSIVNL